MLQITFITSRLAVVTVHSLDCCSACRTDDCAPLMIFTLQYALWCLATIRSACRSVKMSGTHCGSSFSDSSLSGGKGSGGDPGVGCSPPPDSGHLMIRGECHPGLVCTAGSSSKSVRSESHAASPSVCKGPRSKFPDRAAGARSPSH
jgi:hypothetical protein